MNLRAGDGEERPLRTWLKTRFPLLVPVVRMSRRATRRVRLAAKSVVAIRYQIGPMSRRFDRIMRSNAWRSGESASGPGSDLDETEVIRRELPVLIRDLGARTLLDIPCGDFHWMRHVPLGVEKYIGADVVPRLIYENNANYARPDREFIVLDVRSDALPRADIVLSRDCFDHLSFQDAGLALANIVRSESKYLLITTYTHRASNRNIRTGDWRPLNLLLPPFSLPDPLRLIDERSRKEGYPDKSLGLWKVEDIATALRIDDAGG